ncbi:MAG: nucleotidyl transferase AbiEii/AbiGii toxin family protein [Tissierellales bacterium]|nr:nucleotidyl transferase AbiEii/AbiGii toxin family protein [Tissierellales bacterium]MBN2828294.1 nucleotidyl transferase AbiEii/AbiGii toxin family protein [Tissierellales bacterium]
MRLHKNTDDFSDLIRITSDYLGLDPTIVEKDYWITHALYHLSKSEYMGKVVFKGGTSLTKCYEDLHRFSEDIDIALLANGMTNSQIKKTIQKVEEVMSFELSPGEFEDERKSGDYRYTQFTYRSMFSGDLSELHPNIRFELTSFMYPHPFEKREVGTFIEQYLNQNVMHDVINEFELGKFELNVLSIERTVVEKLASLIRMSYDVDLKEIQTKTRHLYDLYMTYHLVSAFYEDDDALSEMVAIVKESENESRFKNMYPIDNLWNTAPLFSILNDSRIEIAYREHFGSEFVYGNLPDFKDVKNVIFELQKVLIRCNI